MFKKLYNSARNWLFAVKALKVARSSRWPALRKKFLKDNPFCRACGGTDKLEVHHIMPVHMDWTKELDETNLITLCDSPKRICHLRVGHSWDFSARNPYCACDAASEYKRVKERKYS